MMTQEQLDSMEALCEKATKGPWQILVQSRNAIGADGVLLYTAPPYESRNNAANNQAFILASRTFIPAAIKRIRELEEELRVVNACLNLTRTTP